MPRMRRLGEILTSNGLITEAELDAALAEQKGSNRRLGEILVENKIISHSILTVFLAQQLGVEYVTNDKALTEKLIPIKNTLSSLEAARYQAVLLGKEEDDTVIVGIVDPYDYEMLRELLNKLNAAVKFALLTPYIFTKFYDECYYENSNIA